MGLPEELGYIARRRKELGLTQARLAEMASVSQAYISRLEKGKLDPRLSTVRRILGVLEEGRKARTLIKEVMSKPVIAVGSHESVSKTVRIMTEHGFSQMPVLEDGVPVGSISERTILRKMAVTKNPSELGMSRLSEIMEASPPSLPPEAEVSQALTLLEAYPMVLVMERGVVTGIVTRADVLRMIGQASK